jgi:hypothetical protein
MSDATPAEPVPPSPARSERPLEGPVLKPATFGGSNDEDNSLLSHLGLPLYYRHTPTRAARRGVMYLVSGLLMLLFFADFLYMPHPSDSVFTLIRQTVFGDRPFMTVEDGFRAVFNQMAVLATILSSICAPALATLSLSNERANGTMEFLRLAPLSMQSIVLGKMFAPAYVIHLISGVMLAIGAAAGLAGGIPLTSVALASLAIVLGSMTFHAVGAYMACMPSARGAAVVMGLLILMFVLTMLALAAKEERGLSFLGYVSPWSALDAEIWQTGVRRRGAYGPVEFFGFAGGAKYYMLLFHAVAVALLVWAASSKLDKPEQPALPWRAWAGLWAFVLFTALGTSFNLNGYAGWALPAGIMGMAGGAVCALILIDHPHRRDTVLADECELLAHGDNRSQGRFSRLRHTFFGVGMVVLTALAVMLFVWNSRLSTWSAEYQIAWQLCALAVVAAFVISLIMEVSFLAYVSFTAQSIFAGGIATVFVLILMVPLFMIGSSHSTFMTAVYFKERIEKDKQAELNAKNQALPAGAKARPQNNYGYYYDLSQPQYQVYLKDAQTVSELSELRQKYRDNPLRFYLHYHADRFAIFCLMWIGSICGLVWFRKRVYAGLKAEARKAVMADAAPPSVATA